MQRKILLCTILLFTLIFTSSTIFAESNQEELEKALNEEEQKQEEQQFDQKEELQIVKESKWPFIDEDKEDDDSTQKIVLKETPEYNISTNGPKLDLSKEDVYWLDQINYYIKRSNIDDKDYLFYSDLITKYNITKDKIVQPLESDELGTLENPPLIRGTRVIVTLKSASILGNNESGADEWRFSTKWGDQTFDFPSSSGYYVVSYKAQFPYTIDINHVLYDDIYPLSNGQTLGIFFDATATEVDPFFDDVSSAIGAQGLTIPVEKIWYNMIATGDTPVQFNFEITAVPAY